MPLHSFTFMLLQEAKGTAVFAFF